MARYWVYINGDVAGPYSVEQLLRLRDFSRQTQVCEEDGSGQPRAWISLSQVPELSHIFQKSDQLHELPTPKAKPKPAPKPAAPPRRSAPISTPTPAPSAASHGVGPWPWIVGGIVICLLAAAAGIAVKSFWSRERQQRASESVRIVRAHVLPADSLYATLDEYILEKRIRPRWEVEEGTAGISRTTVSWGGSAGTPSAPPAVYAFEVNRQAQTLRGLNTAAQRLLNEGFPRPPVKAAPAAMPEPKKGPSFESVVDRRREAVSRGDFAAVWDFYSDHRRSEMMRAGISQAGFVRLQSLTRALEPDAVQTVLKSRTEADGRRLVLLRQTQARHPDLYLKQTWVLQDNVWKLDDEEKRSASPAPSEAAAPEMKTEKSSGTSAVPPVPDPSGGEATATPPMRAPATPIPPPREKVMSLPGLSSDGQH